MFKHPESGHPLHSDESPRGLFRHAEIRFEWLDYEPPGKSAKVVEAPEGPEKNKSGPESTEEIGSERSDRVGNEGSA
ncbi:hypothetical protein, partial [Streptomyces sp. NPDC047974]|uniref:hypothetical protein n=1 Tax=Streptomyces sp. NPDC047974 TaxID=3154343 RepID=UPI0033FE40E9